MKQIEFTEEEIIKSLQGVGIEVTDICADEPSIPTNRQWLESLTDKQLAQFLIHGLKVESAHYIGDYPFYINITCIASKYTQSTLGIENWLSMPQDYIVVEE